jgi:type I restriction enzyme S subunit
MIGDLKPYPEYTRSDMPWMASIPKHWHVRRMKFLFSERAQKGFPDEPLLAATQTKGVVRKETYGQRTVTASKDFHLLKLVEQGDFVISLRSFEGGIEVAHDRGIISPAYTVLRPRGGVQPGYYSHFLKSKSLIAGLTLFVTGIREGQNIDYVRLSRAYLPLPPEEEQLAIGKFLDWANGRLERAIRAKRKVIALLNEQKQAIIHRAVTRGRDPSVPLKPSGAPGIGNIPQTWRVVPLKFLCRRIQNGATPPSSERHYFEDGNVPWFGPSSVGKALEVGTPGQYLASAAFTDGKARLIDGPALLMVVIGATAGKTALLRGVGSTNQQITAFELTGDTALPEFVVHQARCAEEWLRSTASTATIPILDSTLVNRLLVAFPPKEEQREILADLSRRLEPIEDAASKLEREVRLIEEYRVRLSADVVTGKLDVREAAALLPESEELESSEVDEAKFDLEEAEEEGVA